MGRADAAAGRTSCFETARGQRELTADLPGQFRASAFEYRPYPGTPDWHRLMATGRYTARQLLNYSAVDLTHAGADTSMAERDEFNFSTNLPLADAPIDYVRAQLIALSREQYARKAAAA
jgi:anaerobic magnesium-protoporphyrin IX monomethyl ester cyclase